MYDAKLLSLAALGLTLGVTGCDSPAPSTKVEVKKAAPVEDDDHDNHGPGPHGGTVIELGKYHGELVVDHGKKQATVYVLDGKVKSPVPVAAPKLLVSVKSPQFQAELLAVPQTGDPQGLSSRFVATHDNFGKEQDFEGTVSGEIDGKPYLGDFKLPETGHDHKMK